jgi:hypothetical protein
LPSQSASQRAGRRTLVIPTERHGYKWFPWLAHLLVRWPWALDNQSKVCAQADA